MFKEFKTFIMRGNVVDLAVAVIIGAAFSAIIGSLVADIITPLILKPAMAAMGASKLEELSWNGVLYGKFLATVLNFIVVAFCIFMMIKGMNKMQKKKEEESAAPAGPSQEELLAEIRDLLKK
jgi:large conductance mechanosensitive channel